MAIVYHDGEPVMVPNQTIKADDVGIGGLIILIVVIGFIMLK